jgi:Mlc titration factor MtfA (ptsG expression regulator)
MTLVWSLVFFAALLLAVPAWLWGPPLVREFRRARIRRRPFPPAWRQVLRQRMPLFRRLPADLQLQLKRHVQVLLAEKPFIGCAGLVVTDEMRVLIAAQAALLLLNRRAGYFRNLRQILVYPGTFVAERSTIESGGITREARRVLAGESWQHGQVILAWDAVLEGAATPNEGHNVVIHEFAHQLDQETGVANGAPFLGRRDRYARWAAVLSAEFERLRERVARGEPGLIDAYGAGDAAEFFAVVSEVFFGRSPELAAAHPALYRELVAYYSIDPLTW